MKNLVKDLQITDYIKGRKGTFQVVTKCGAGHFVISTTKAVNVYQAFRSYQPKALWTITFTPEGSDYGLTVFAKKNAKTIITMDKELAENLNVGDINQDLSNTNLYNRNQYQEVNAKTWADKVFVQN